MGALVLQKQQPKAGATAWRPELEALDQKLDTLDQKVAGGLDELAARVESCDGRVAELQRQVSDHDQKLSASNQVIIAIEQLLTAKVAEFDQRFETQGRSIEAIQTTVSQTEELVERVVDSVHALPQGPADGHGAVAFTTVDKEEELAQVRELQL